MPLLQGSAQELSTRAESQGHSSRCSELGENISLIRWRVEFEKFVYQVVVSCNHIEAGFILTDGCWSQHNSKRALDQPIVMGIGNDRSHWLGLNAAQQIH